MHFFQRNVCLSEALIMPMLLIMRRNAYTIDCNRSHFLIPFALLFQSPISNCLTPFAQSLSKL